MATQVITKNSKLSDFFSQLTSEETEIFLVKSVDFFQCDVSGKNSDQLLANILKLQNDLTNLKEDKLKSLSYEISQSIQKNSSELENSIRNENRNVISDVVKDIKALIDESDKHDLNAVENLVRDTKESLLKEFSDTKFGVDSIANVFLNKSSLKGRISENAMEILLSQRFPSCIIKRTSGSSKSGDFILKDPLTNKPDILIENKEYDKNVKTDEVVKFVRDTKEQSISGIMLSHNSGIAGKHNFDIEFQDKNVLVYIHNANYDIGKVTLAMDVIYSLTEFLKECDNDAIITSNDINDIQRDYIQFVKTRNDIVSSMKLSIKKVESLDISSLREILQRYSRKFNGEFGHTCDICGLNYPTQQSLSAHKRKHKKTETSE